MEEARVFGILQEIKWSQAALQGQQQEMQQKLQQWMEREEAQRNRSSGGNRSTSRSVGTSRSEGTTKPKESKLKDSQNEQCWDGRDSKSSWVSNFSQGLKNKETAPCQYLRNDSAPVGYASSRSVGKSKIQRFVQNKFFVSFFGLAILANAIVIGCEVDYRTAHVETSFFFKAMQYVFFFIFSSECLVRILAFKSRFFLGRERYWNLFDTTMVAISLLELVDSIVNTESTASSGLVGRIFRIVRMARVMRIFRVLRFSAQLRMMLFMMIESVKSLVWLVCLLLSFLYIFSIIFTMGSIEYLGVPGTATHHPARKHANDIDKYYGTVAKSLYTCFRSMSGGLNWGEVSDPLLDMDMGWFYMSVFLFFILFAVMCFLNVVTGVFVDGALEKSRNDRELVVEKHLNQKKAYIENLRHIFDDGDDDGSGTISEVEFKTYMSDARVEAYFDSLKIDTSDVGALFKMLDRDGSGEIEFDEFIDNLLSLTRAQSPEQALHKLVSETRSTTHDLLRFLQQMEQMFVAIDVSLTSLPSLQQKLIDELELSLRGTLLDHAFPHSIMTSSSRFKAQGTVSTPVRPKARKIATPRDS